MIRVIYRWRVPTAEASKFRLAWEKTTTSIRETTPGARGSVLLHSTQDPTEFLTIARWDTLEDWQAFWKSSSHSDMQSMHSFAELLSTEAFEELKDHTV